MLQLLEVVMVVLDYQTLLLELFLLMVVEEEVVLGQKVLMVLVLTEVGMEGFPTPFPILPPMRSRVLQIEVGEVEEVVLQEVVLVVKKMEQMAVQV